MSDVASIEERLRRLEDRFAIQDLAQRYCSGIDERDLERFLDCFTQDAVLRHHDGTMRLDGLDEIRAYYTERFADYAYTFHYAHSCTVAFDSTNEAHGTITGHAEMSVGRDLFLAAIRYTDRYRAADGAWKFSERELAFGYYMRLVDLPTGFKDELRKHYRGRSLPAELPESLETYQVWNRPGQL